MDQTPAASHSDVTTLLVPPNTPHVSDTNLPVFRYLQKLTSNLAKATHHTEFLNTCSANSNTPKGLRINIQPQLPTTEGTFIIAWSRILEDAQKKLIQTLIDYWKRHVTEIETQIREAYTNLTPDTSDAESRHIREILAKAKLQETSRLKGRRDNKWGGDSSRRNIGNNRGRGQPRPGQSSTSLRDN